METGTFMDIVSAHYKDIRRSFTKRSIDNILDEDSFNDAFIKCAIRFGNENIDYDVAVKYFFTAYKNTHISNLYKEHMYDELDDEFDIECNDENSNLYDDIMDAIAKEYSENDMNIYRLYKCHKWKLPDLIEAGYDCTDFENKIKMISKFVKKYGKTHLNRSV